MSRTVGDVISDALDACHDNPSLDEEAQVTNAVVEFVEDWLRGCQAGSAESAANLWREEMT